MNKTDTQPRINDHDKDNSSLKIIDITGTQESSSLTLLPEPTTAIVGSFKKEKKQCIELGFRGQTH